MHFLAWYKTAVFYEVYVRAFFDANGDGRGDLKGLENKLDYLKDLGVDCLWLNPIYPSPLKDDGYDISNYCSVHPDYGSLEDFINLVKSAHQKGLKIITDMVINHTSDQHPWFQAARADHNSPYRDYYVWSDSGREYAQARIIFLDTETSNWSWDPLAGQYYWHRFYSSQPDLNFDNPQVHAEIEKVIRFWLDLGIDGFRFDAVPYLYEREDSNCENLPETHAFLKKIRRFIDENYPGRIMLCEANQWPEDVRHYFGEGDEFQMAFHFPLMPRIFMALHRQDAAPIRWALDNTPPIPDSTQWCLFLRNHDELTLEMVSEEDRQWMWQEYAPDPGMRLNLGIRRRLTPLLGNDRHLIELANSILFTLPGSPILYYGDEIGMGDNIHLPDRDGIRTPMQWDASPQAGFSTATSLYSPVVHQEPYAPQSVNLKAQQAKPGSLLNNLKKMIAIRKEHPALGSGDFRWIECGTNSALAFERSFAEEKLFCVHNLKSEAQTIHIPLEDERLVLTDVLSGGEHSVQNRLAEITLEAYRYLWLI